MSATIPVAPTGAAPDPGAQVEAQPGESLLQGAWRRLRRSPLAIAGAAPVFVLAYGLASGLMSVMRPACLIELHGAEGYAAVAGRVMAPVTTAMAVAPAAFAPLLLALGAQAALALAALGVLGAFLLLRRAARSA